ncbi:helix-turn-helix domain-containing protein [Nocardia africana]
MERRRAIRPDDLNQVLGAVIAKHREDARLRQEDVWIALGMPRSNYQRLEQGKTRLYPELLARIGRIIGTPGWQLQREAEVQWTGWDRTPEDELRDSLGFT